MDIRRFKQLLESTMGDVKPLISEVEYSMAFGGGTPSTAPDQNKDNGFWGISYKTEGNISSVQNFYDGGNTISERNDFTTSELMYPNLESNISFTYVFDVKGGEVMRVVLNAVTKDGATATESWSNRGPESIGKKFIGRFTLSNMPKNSVITITVEGDEKNKLIVTTK